MKRPRILKHHAPILRQVCQPIPAGWDTRGLERDMRRAVDLTPDGVGLAAPQIGHALRAVLIGRGLSGAFLVNPEIIGRSQEMQNSREGCLSYPGITIEVSRHQWIRIRHRDGVAACYNLTAAVAQHELEHLDGICLVGDEWRRRRDQVANVAGLPPEVARIAARDSAGPLDNQPHGRGKTNPPVP